MRPVLRFLSRASTPQRNSRLIVLSRASGHMTRRSFFFHFFPSTSSSERARACFARSRLRCLVVESASPRKQLTCCTRSVHGPFSCKPKRGHRAQKANRSAILTRRSLRIPVCRERQYMEILSKPTGALCAHVTCNSHSTLPVKYALVQAVCCGHLPFWPSAIRRSTRDALQVPRQPTEDNDEMWWSAVHQWW
jgi:hypothetical protein